MTQSEQHEPSFLLVEDLEEGGLETWFSRNQVPFFLSRTALQLHALPAQLIETATAAVLGLSHSRDTLAALALIRSSRSLRRLPVVAVVPPGAPPNVTQSLRRLGVFLCLERPLISDVLEGALSAAQTYRAVVSSIRPAPHAQPFGQLLREGVFRIRTPEEASSLSEMLAMACPDPGRQMCGIHELLLNGIEHGNLGIDTSGKAEFLREGAWHTELNRRLNLPEHRDKVVVVQFRRSEQEIVLRVRDHGTGFDWRKTLASSPESIGGPNGRGILLARMLSFDSLEYRDPGNEAIARIRIKRNRGQSQDLVIPSALARASQPSAAPLSQSLRPSMPSDTAWNEATAEIPAPNESDELFALSRDVMLVNDGLIRRINPAFTRLLGWTSDEIVGRPVLDYIDPEDRQRRSDEFAQLMANPGVERPPQIVRTMVKGGGSRAIEWSTVIGRDKRAYSVGRDVSTLKHALDALGSQNEELRRLHDAIRREQQFAGQVLSNIRRQGCMDAPGIHYTSAGLEFFNGDITLAATTPQGELRWLLGDFTGHGLCAAIGTTPVASAFYATTKKNIPLPEVVATINDSLKNLMPAGLFCAAGFLALSADARTLYVWNGGLPAVLLRRKNGTVESFASSALPLGLVRSNELGVTIAEIAVDHGDQVFVYSDGLTEAASPHGELFGSERLVQLLRSIDKPETTFERVLADVAAFRGNTQASDDVSLVAVTVGETVQAQSTRKSAAPPRPAARPSQAPRA